MPFFIVFLAITFFSKFPLIYAIISNNRRIFLYNKNMRLIACRKLATLHELINKLNQDLLYGKYIIPWSAPKIIFFLFHFKEKKYLFQANFSDIINLIYYSSFFLCSIIYIIIGGSTTWTLLFINNMYFLFYFPYKFYFPSIQSNTKQKLWNIKKYLS